MVDFKVIPVLDILNSEAVHAVKGERSKYLPIKSKLIKTSNPVKIINYFNQQFNFNEFYIADLDAIIKKKANFGILSEILKISNVRINIDPGIMNKKDILMYSKYKIYKLILGLESIENYNVIDNGLKIMGSNGVIVSIDMLNGKIISKIEELKGRDPLFAVNILKEKKIEELILLDLYRVGQKIGGIPPRYLEIQKEFKGKLIVGGGIKNLNDVLMYKNEGFAGVLIATALHDGTIDLNELKTLNLY